MADETTHSGDSPSEKKARERVEAARTEAENIIGRLDPEHITGWGKLYGILKASLELVEEKMKNNL
ncbi:MAG: hypothetical protein Q8P89_01620 [bacterium]|nr:hypothetical protein [bacterium]